MEEINLKDFVKETLLEITEGIYGAKTMTKKEYTKTPISPRYGIEDKYQASKISFDIAVTTSKTTNNSKDGGLKIKVVDASISNEKVSSKEYTNRIKFDIPFFPSNIPEIEDKSY